MRKRRKFAGVEAFQGGVGAKALSIDMNIAKDR